MPLNTKYYFLTSFLDGDAFSAIADKNRFITVDNQLFAISSLIDDGCIIGWDISADSDFPLINISPGTGLINKYYVSTFAPIQLELEANNVFYVFAQRKNGITGANGPRSNLASISYEDENPPDPVSDFTSNIVDDFFVYLSWSSNIDPDLSFYEIWKSSDGISYSLLFVIDTLNQTFYIDEEVDEQITYYYKIFAVDLSGNKSNSSDTNITTPLSGNLPPDPFPFTIFPAVGAINATWEIPSTIVFSKIDHFEISYVKLNLDETEDLSTYVYYDVSSLLLFYRINNLVIGEKYKVTIKTVDIKGRKSLGLFSKITIPNKASAPLDPVSISYSTENGQFGQTVNISWSSGDNEYFDINTYRYRIYVTPNGAKESLPIDVPIGFAAEQISLFSYDNINWFRINEDATYLFRITALSNSRDLDNESFGNIIKIGTPKTSLPTIIKQLSSVFDYNNGLISIVWINNPDTDHILIKITETDLEDSYLTNVLIVNSNLGKASKYVLTNVSINRKYTIEIIPVDVNNQQGLSSFTSVLTLITGSSSTPPIPAISSIISGDKSITIDWIESDDFSIKYYNIYRKTGDVTYWLKDWTLIDTLPSTITTFIDYGLDNDQLYSYFITSVNVYGTESALLSDKNYNMNFIQETPSQSGLLTEPYNLSVSLDGTNVSLEWEAVSDEFDSFIIYRSKNNLHTWEKIGTVNNSTFVFIDSNFPLINGTVFYYSISKIINDVDMISLTENILPVNSVFIGVVTADSSSITIDQTDRRIIKDFVDPIKEYTEPQLLTHRHLDPYRIQLSENVIVNNWITDDGQIFTTTDDLTGSDYIVTVNGRIPSVFYSVDSSTKSLSFSESIGKPSDTFNISVTIIGTSEVQGTLLSTYFGNLTAQQVQYGTISKKQIPLINHEGRIQEKMLPVSFSLQKYSDYEFIIPEKTTDTNKNFGNGTCFYCVTESDGLLNTIVNFDSFSDGSEVCFNKPSFASDTRHNLSQTVYSTAIISGEDNSYDINSSDWESNPLSLPFGIITGSDEIDLLNDVYLKFIIDIPKNAILSDASIIFTAIDSVGTDIFLDIFMLDFSVISNNADLSVPIRSIPSIGDVLWVPDIWVTDQKVQTPDISSLIQNYIDSPYYVPGNAVFFKIKTEPITSYNSYRIASSYPTNAPELSISYVLDTAEVTSSPSGFYGNKSYLLEFQFKDNSDYRWVRVTTENASFLPNPVIDLKKRIRFRLLTNLNSFYLTLGIREIKSTTTDVGNNGGTDGPIEWVGIDSFISDPSGNEVPIGLLITAKQDEWQEIDIDLSTAKTMNFKNGDGVLSSSFGVLEHLAFTINSDNTIDSYSIYIDRIEQITDVLTAGTSEGILLSRDFGSTWKLISYTSTPVKKIIKASNNGFLWAISNNEVFISTDPAFWFTTIGTFGIHSIKDITEDNNGNMYISSDKGVYWFDISIISQYALWQQTLPINAFTTDTYALYHDFVSSGIDEINVSTEVGIYKTNDNGQTWVDSGFTTGTSAATQIFNISENILNPILIAITKNSIFIKTITDDNFRLLTNFEKEYGIKNIWQAEFFNGLLYILTDNGLFYNDLVDFSDPNLSITFNNHVKNLNNNVQTLSFGINKIQKDNYSESLFVGQEGRVVVVSDSNIVSPKYTEHGKQFPIFYIDGTIVNQRYQYNAFNKVLCFSSPIDSLNSVFAAYLPLKIFTAEHGGWSLSRPLADVFIYLNNVPKWIDFKIDNDVFINDIGSVSSILTLIRPLLNSINSDYPNSINVLDIVISDISNIVSGGPVDSAGNTTSDISETTIKTYLKDYVYFLSLVTDSFKTDNSIPLPRLMTFGFPINQRQTGSKADTFEQTNGSQSIDSTGISINIYDGTIDFTTAFQSSTSLADQSKFTFYKNDVIKISIFNANLSETGHFTHNEIENTLESINTGLSVGLTNILYGNFLQAGVNIQRNLGNVFADNKAKKIQVEYYPANESNWYDKTASTIDHKIITESSFGAEGNYVTNVYVIDAEPYLSNAIWVSTDNGIFKYSYTDGILSLDGFISISSDKNFVYSLFVSDLNEIFSLTWDNNIVSSALYKSVDYGSSWSTVPEFNLPKHIYYMNRINGNDIISTNSGMFYSDNAFNTWYKASVSLSSKLDDSSLITNFSNKSINIINDNYIIIEINKAFYKSSNGIDYIAAGTMGNSVTVINKIYRFKNITFAGTDIGLFADGNSIMSDKVAFNRYTDIETTSDLSASISINDIDSYGNKLYCCSNTGKIYRYYDNGDGQQWTQYQVPELTSIQFIKAFTDGVSELLLIINHDMIKVIDVTSSTGVFG